VNRRYFAIALRAVAIVLLIVAAFRIAIAARLGTSNPNLKAIAEMKKSGVEFLVCGQYLAAEKIAPKSLTPDVTLAADALLVLIHYQNQGYAMLTFCEPTTEASNHFSKLRSYSFKMTGRPLARTPSQISVGWQGCLPSFR
jgi:intracellular sulfur oxidation DsrE/DsrF family protein